MLSNDKIKLRAVEPEDLDILYKWENTTALWMHGNTLAPYSKLVLRQYINDTLSMDIYQSRQLRLMVDNIENNATVGTIDLYDIDIHNRRAGIGIVIDDDHRRNGYAIQALNLMADYAFNFLYLHQLYAYIAIGNTKSINLFVKIGYQEAGTLKEWLQRGDTFEDVLIFQYINPKSE